MSQPNPIIDRVAVVDALAAFRQAWQEGVGGQDLVDVQANIGLVLGDLVVLMGLTRDEQVAALGEPLRRSYLKACREQAQRS